jgi:hypothetical protein
MQMICKGFTFLGDQIATGTRAENQRETKPDGIVAMTEKFSKKFVKLKIRIIRTSKNRQKI